MSAHRCFQKGWLIIRCKMCPRGMHYRESWSYVPEVCSEKCAEDKARGEPQFLRIESPVFDTCEVCGVCLFAGYREPGRDKTIHFCNNCQAAKDVVACLAEENRKEELSKRLREAHLKSGRLVEVDCFLCGRKTIMRKSMAEKLDFHYCDSSCGKIARAVKLSRKLLVYTPKFLRSLMEQDRSLCHFPGCEESKSPFGKQNLFGSCRLHAQRLYVALCARRQVRKRMLEENGIST